MRTRRSFLQNAGGAALTALAAPYAALAAPPRKPAPGLPYVPLEEIPNHRQWMRDIVIALSDYCKKRSPDMKVLVRNGPELLIKEQREADWEAGRDPDGAARGRYGPVGSVDAPYLNAIDGMLIDGLFYGHDQYEKPTDKADTTPLLEAATVLRQQGRHALSIEYCKDPKNRSDALGRVQKAGLLSYIDGEGDRSLSRIPPGAPPGENAKHVTDITGAKNFLPLLSANAFGRRDQWVDALAATNHDLLIVDPFWRGGSMTVQDVKALRFKRLGSQRLFFAPLPVGFASVDRFFWQKGWHVGNPDWVAAPDPNGTGRFITSYWMESWKTILGNYVTGLCDLGIDGVILDGVDSYLFFEAALPI